MTPSGLSIGTITKSSWRRSASASAEGPVRKSRMPCLRGGRQVAVTFVSAHRGDPLRPRHAPGCVGATPEPRKSCRLGSSGGAVGAMEAGICFLSPRLRRIMKLALLSPGCTRALSATTRRASISSCESKGCRRKSGVARYGVRQIKGCQSRLRRSVVRHPQYLARVTRQRAREQLPPHMARARGVGLNAWW